MTWHEATSDRQSKLKAVQVLSCVTDTDPRSVTLVWHWRDLGTESHFSSSSTCQRLVRPHSSRFTASDMLGTDKQLWEKQTCECSLIYCFKVDSALHFINSWHARPNAAVRIQLYRNFVLFYYYYADGDTWWRQAEWRLCGLFISSNHNNRSIVKPLNVSLNSLAVGHVGVAGSIFCRSAGETSASGRLTHNVRLTTQPAADWPRTPPQLPMCLRVDGSVWIEGNVITWLSCVCYDWCSWQ